MKDQLKTIREALERLSCLGNGSHYGNSDGNRIAQEVLPLARQLESLVGEQEPICWAESDGEGGILWDRDSCFSDDPAWFDSPMPLYAAPVAQQPQAEPLGETPTPAKNMAAPVASWDDSRTQKVYEVLTNDNYPPKGSADHWEGWKARLVVDALFPEQPQAETVQQKPKLIGWRTSDYLMETSDRDKADNWAVHHEMLPIFEGDPYTKLVAPPQQAAHVSSDTLYLLRRLLANRSCYSRQEFEDEAERIISTAPQQAEAVPPDVVRDAEQRN